MSLYIAKDPILRILDWNYKNGQNEYNFMYIYIYIYIYTVACDTIIQKASLTESQGYMWKYHIPYLHISKIRNIKLHTWWYFSAPKVDLARSCSSCDGSAPNDRMKRMGSDACVSFCMMWSRLRFGGDNSFRPKEITLMHIHQANHHPAMFVLFETKLALPKIAKQIHK